MHSMKRQKDRTLKDELPRSVGAQYATGDQWRNIRCRHNENVIYVISLVRENILKGLTSFDFCLLQFAL